MKPNYLCIGVQKGGTTSLINYLNLHPEIYMAGEKHFFSRRLSDGELSHEDIKNYEKSFKTTKTIVGEKTPSYCYLRYAIDRIYDYDKNMKLIIILREPISRAFSEYNMILNSQEKTLSDKSEEEMFNEIISESDIKLNQLKAGGAHHVIRGFYDEILEYILSKFSRDNLYIGISEEINKNKHKYYNEIYEFLGTTKLTEIDDTLNNHIREYTEKMPKKLEKYLYNVYKPHNEKLYKILGRKIDSWENYYIQLKSAF